MASWFEYKKDTVSAKGLHKSCNGRKKAVKHTTTVYKNNGNATVKRVNRGWKRGTGQAFALGEATTMNRGRGGKTVERIGQIVSGNNGNETFTRERKARTENLDRREQH